MTKNHRKDERVTLELIEKLKMKIRKGRKDDMMECKK